MSKEEARKVIGVKAAAAREKYGPPGRMQAPIDHQRNMFDLDRRRIKQLRKKEQGFLI